jgi:tartrate-resistant acid phosphatase type 5
MARLIPLFQRSGVKVMFSGHEHNFQHSRADGIDYVVTGAAGKFRAGTPDAFGAAHTLSWSTQCHLVLARIEGDRMTVRAIGGMQAGAANLTDIVRQRPDGEIITGPIEIRRI